MYPEPYLRDEFYLSECLFVCVEGGGREEGEEDIEVFHEFLDMI